MRIEKGDPAEGKGKNMKITEIGRLVFLNLTQNKTKVVLTSTGIIVGAATIMLVIAIGTGGREEVAEQFKNLNAGAVDISYEYQGNRSRSQDGFPGMGQAPGSMSAGAGGMMSGAAAGVGGASGGAEMTGGTMGGRAAGGAGDMQDSAGFPERQMPEGSFTGEAPAGDGSYGEGGSPGMGGFPWAQEQSNTEKITLSEIEMKQLKQQVEGITDATISYTARTETDGGELEEAVTYTVAGVKENYAVFSNLELAVGEFLTEEEEEARERVCVLGYGAAKEIFGSALAAYDEAVYLDGRPYVVAGVLEEMGNVTSGISPDDTIFIPYETGIKYVTGKDVSPTITVIAGSVDEVDAVMEEILQELKRLYPNAEFTLSDAGSKMEAASSANRTLTLLLISMSVIVFLVGGIGIMNVLFVSVKERTNEIGILKAVGCSRRDILLEFLLEAACISLVGALIGVLAAFGLTPVIEQFAVRVELSVPGAVMSLFFGVCTGTLFGFYPAYRASRMVPVEALNLQV